MVGDRQQPSRVVEQRRRADARVERNDVGGLVAQHQGWRRPSAAGRGGMAIRRRISVTRSIRICRDVRGRADFSAGAAGPHEDLIGALVRTRLRVGTSAFQASIQPSSRLQRGDAATR
jgi:hypothetical protein